MFTWHPIPYGVSDIDPGQAISVAPDHVRCCIKGCGRLLQKAHRGTRKSPDCFCPAHDIRVSPSRPTYVFRDQYRNVIVAHDVFAAVRKTESWRLPNETSEDALSWNVFVGLASLGRLREAARVLSGVTVDVDPELYLWGNKITPDGATLWPALVDVRIRLEDELKIQTEPDIAIRVPGKLLVVIEAKFGSKNGTLDGKDYECVEEFLDRYESPMGSDPLNRTWIVGQSSDRILEQLCRMAVFGAWLGERGEDVVVVSLMRRQELAASPPDVASHLVPGGPVRFQARAWEDLIPLAAGAPDHTLRRYLADKSYGLRPAFTGMHTLGTVANP